MSHIKEIRCKNIINRIKHKGRAKPDPNKQVVVSPRIPGHKQGLNSKERLPSDPKDTSENIHKDLIPVKLDVEHAQYANL